MKRKQAKLVARTVSYLFHTTTDIYTQPVEAECGRIHPFYSALQNDEYEKAGGCSRKMQSPVATREGHYPSIFIQPTGKRLIMLRLFTLSAGI